MHTELVQSCCGWHDAREQLDDHNLETWRSGNSRWPAYWLRISRHLDFWRIRTRSGCFSLLVELPPALAGALLRLTASFIVHAELLVNFALGLELVGHPFLVGMVVMGAMARGIALEPRLLYGGADMAPRATLEFTTPR